MKIHVTEDVKRMSVEELKAGVQDKRLSIKGSTVDLQERLSRARLGIWIKEKTIKSDKAVCAKSEDLMKLTYCVHAIMRI